LAEKDLERDSVMFMGNTRIVHDHLKSTKKGLTMNDIAATTGLEKKSVKSAINRLDEYGLLARVGKQGVCTLYQYSMSPKLSQPNGKGYGKGGLTTLGKPSFVPVRNGTTSSKNWTAPQMECVRTDGTAFLGLKSIDNGREIERKAPMIICVGVKNLGPIVSGRPSRLA
jgi:hypothetical protein